MAKSILSITNDFINISIDTVRTISNKEELEKFAKDIFEVIGKLNSISVNGICVSASLQRGCLDDLADGIRKDKM